MNKKNNRLYYFIFILILMLVASISYFMFRQKNNSNMNYEPQKISTESTSDENDSKESNSMKSESEENDNSEHIIETKYTDKFLSEFSTKILTNDKARENNLNLTSQKLNGTVVKVGETFSFCNTLGPSTKEKGYQKADIFDKDGNKKKEYGGGNCQISSTLYNAVLKCNELEIIERHKHSNKVYYVPENKDAAVFYGSYDFKFKNNSQYDLKILSSIDLNNKTVNITINSIVPEI